MSGRTLRWGVLGTANIARGAVNPAIQASDNGTLVAVASREEERAREFAEEHEIPRWFGSYEALLDAPDIDAVYVPLPNALHREWTIRAAEAGKHVLCEKPLALSERECDEMIDAARLHGVRLMEAFMYRFHPRTDRAVAMIRGGDIGELKVVRSAFTFRLSSRSNIRLNAALGGGALMDVGCYCVNASRTLVGEEPVEVSATARWTEGGVDDQLAGVLRFGGGVIAHFDCALTMERQEFYEAAGTDGHLRVESAFLPGTDDVVLEQHRGRKGVEEHAVAGVDEYRLMVEHFADAVLNDEPFRYPASEAAANMRVIEALYLSAGNAGRPVSVARTLT